MELQQFPHNFPSSTGLQKHVFDDVIGNAIASSVVGDETDAASARGAVDV